MAIKFLNTVQVDTDVLYVDASTNKVGIGTTSPSTVLEVSSTGVNGVDISQSASNASQSGRLFFTTNTASEGFALFNSNGTFQVNSGGIPNNTSGTNRISIIGSSGNVGIGTTSPSTKLHVSGGDIRIDDTEKIEFGAGGVRINNDAAGRMYYRAPLGFYWETNGGYRMVLNSSGNVGIGTTTPGTYRLAVAGSTNIGGNVEVSDGLGGDQVLTLTANTGSFKIGDIEGIGDEGYIEGDSSSIKIFTGGSETLVCDINQNVGMGTTSLTTISAAVTTLSLGSTSASTSGGIAFQANGVVKAYNYVAGNYLYSQTVTGVGQVFYGAGSEQMRIHNTTGNIGIGTTSPVSKLQVKGDGHDANFSSGCLIVEQNTGARMFIDGNDIDTADGTLFLNDYSLNAIRLGGVLQVVNTGSSYFAGNVGIGTTIPQSKLQVNGGVQLANDTAVASASKVGTFRYRTSGNNSLVDMCMQTGASTYAWVNIVTNNW